MFDHYVGQLISHLSHTEDPRWPGHKLIENTYIIFTSDNGGMEKVPGEIITDNFPLDRGKISLEEGGVRVPLIIAGPEIKAGQESEVIVNGLDFYPTILTWTNTDKPQGVTLDGCDLTKLLEQNPRSANLVKHTNGHVRDTMVWHFPHGVAQESTIRENGWKLIFNYMPGREHCNSFSSIRITRLVRNGLILRNQETLQINSPTKPSVCVKSCLRNYPQ
jgi:arylsulfatase A-like enzyme